MMLPPAFPKACPNCGQWQHPTRNDNTGDCLNNCRQRGFAPPPLKIPRYALTDAGKRVHAAISIAAREISNLRNAKRRPP